MSGTVRLSFTGLIDNNSTSGAVKHPINRIQNEMLRDVKRIYPKINMAPIYASVPSIDLRFLIIHFFPNANPNIFPNVSPKTRKVVAAIAISFSNNRILMNNDTKKTVIDEKVFRSSFL